MTDRLLLFIITVFIFSAYSQAQNTIQSVLSAGEIYKLSVEKTGVYRIDYNYLKNTLGLSLNNIDPRNIHIYSNPGGRIPQKINDPRVDDLNELEIFVSGESDGRFDNNDYILVYAEGADRYKSTGPDIVFEKNIYDLKNYLFLKIENIPGERIQNMASMEAEQYSENHQTIIRHENEWRNLLADFGGTQGTGQQWFGESFANERIQDFSSTFRFPNLVTGTQASAEILLAARSDKSSTFELKIGEQAYSSDHDRIYSGNVEYKYATTNFINKNFTLTEKEPSVILEYKPQVANSEAWLDYIEVRAMEKIDFKGTALWLQNPASVNFETYGYRFQSAFDPFIWDVTDLQELSAIDWEQQASEILFGYRPEDLNRMFIVFDPAANFPAPKFEEKLYNQNLHVIDRADFIIVYHPDFEDAAVSLATHRENFDNMAVSTVNILEIYNEFGGGRKDPAALRDFVKMVHDRDPGFRYLLLLGDASYDYRGIDNDIPDHNFIPTFETPESLHPIYGFPTDDFFGLLSDGEGDDLLKGDIEIGIGRIPCTTAEEADAVVNKIIHYDSHPSRFGEWRMNIGFAADDMDEFWDRTHFLDADAIAQSTEIRHPQFNQTKIYFDAFPQVATHGGQRYPEANALINEKINRGTLVMSYLGHGGSKGLAQERVVQVPDIQNWKSMNNLPILLTATCSFAGFDEPTVRSAGEYAILNPQGGAIALFTTVRAVIANSNYKLTRDVYEKIFSTDQGNRLRFGDIIRLSQNENPSDNSRKFLLIGDPSLTVALPEYNIQLDRLNDNVIDDQSLDTLGALSRTKIEGSITDHIANLISNFNGDLYLTVYDKKKKRSTLDNDNHGVTYDFHTQNSILYKGKASVTNGKFQIEFILPKDIDFSYGAGKLSMYATDNSSMDAGGYYDKIIIGGISENAVSDSEGPEINIFLGDRSFKSGDLTGAHPLLIVDLEDESGINLSSTSIGHDITATLDNDITEQLILNDFYNPLSDRLGAGTVEYQLKNLEPGPHTIRIKAWDILNNSSEASVDFIVTEDEDGFIKDVYNYPNPLSTETYFSFTQDLANTDIEVAIDIFSLSGQYVASLNHKFFSANSRIDDIYWDGKTTFGDFLANGIYIYKINIFAPELNQRRESNFYKLVILN